MRARSLPSAKKIEDEQEAYRVMEVFLGAKTKKMEAKIQEQEEALAEKDKLIAELRRKLEGK